MFDKLVDPLEKLLDDGGLEIDEIHDVLLVGGSTRCLFVREWLTEYFGKPPNDTVNADEAVAYGATIMAGKLCPNSTNLDPR